ncbi:MAG: hypothetical protein LBC83_01275 [Oscillospiraceae bacterium]|jgi:ABC-type transport system involved in multi-copper enzyme maturation permease subunit|nr:hypothetical protein [Oscillospiraceae bacterium]
MLRYLRGEIYRLLRKKSFYIYFGAFALGYVILAFIRMGSSGERQMLKDAESLFMFLPPVVGSYLFAAIYTDDLHAKNLPALIGFGVGRIRIVLSKLLLMSLFGTVLLALVPLFMYAVHTVFGASPTGAVFGEVYAWGLKALMETVAFASLSAVAVYGLQRATFGIAVYLLLSLGVVSQLLSALFRWEAVHELLPGLAEHLMAGISLRMLMGLMGNGAVVLPAVEYAVYVTVAAALAALAFHKKELEF